jgi:triosephosphate isomerase
MRKPLIAGNWKLHNTLAQARELAGRLAAEVGGLDEPEVVIAPVFTSLTTVATAISGTAIRLAAQNSYPVDDGAFTGEVSPKLLKDAGCSYIISGHSERRQLLGETDQMINRKVCKTLETGLAVILCIGETLQERETDQMLEVLTRQVRDGLAGVSAEQMEAVVIAYEPVWAIGTGVSASDEQAQEAHAFIRGMLQGLFNQQVAAATRILYGGSVKPGNIDSLMVCEDIDGALVGGASLKSEDFLRIVKFEKKG